MFPPGLVGEVVAGAGVVEQRIRVLPARLVVYYTLAMIVFFQSSYSQVWVKLVGGLDWAKSFRARVAVGMSPSPAAISKARARLGWQVMADLLERVAGPLAGQDDGWAYVAGLRCRVNVIPCNPGPDPRWRPPTVERVDAFVARLSELGVTTLVRRPRGRDVGGACGQLAGALRASAEEVESTPGH